MANPFAILGVAPTMDLDPMALERRYLELSRACHPDHHASADASTQAATMLRAAELNDAYRTLRSPWQRARVLCEQLAPGVTEATKNLPPEFLMTALELAEDVAHASPDSGAVLEQRIDARLDAYLIQIRTALARGDARDAAQALHEARYWQKARTDLDANDDS